MLSHQSNACVLSNLPSVTDHSTGVDLFKWHCNQSIDDDPSQIADSGDSVWILCQSLPCTIRNLGAFDLPCMHA